MAAAPKTKTTEAKAAAEALERLDAQEPSGEDGKRFIEASIEQRAVAGAMRERDHLEGCPVLDRPDGASRVEGFAERVVAPSPNLRQRGVAAGDTVVIVTCQECGGRRYVAGHPSYRDFLRHRLAELAGVEEAAPSEDDLDSTL